MTDTPEVPMNKPTPTSDSPKGVSPKGVSPNGVSLNDEGYLTDFSQWTREVAIQIAAEEEIDLTEPHWKVISFLQACHQESVPLSIRMFGKKGPVSIKELYVLFPGGPLKKSTRIAGIPKPASCI